MREFNHREYQKIRRQRIHKNYKRQHRQERVGRLGKKVLLLLAAGVSLSLTHRPDRQFRIIRSVGKEWMKINEKGLKNSIRRLYQSRLLDYEENAEGTVAITLGEKGKIRSLKYNLDKIKIKQPVKWDGFWRMVMFDIPEHKKQARDTFARKLWALGFVALQKSVFVYPYECRDELDFIVEVFGLKPYVRFALVKELDIALDLKRRFGL